MTSSSSRAPRPQRLFRKNDAAAETTPWSDKPAELGIAPDGGAGNPADPRLPWTSTTQVDLDLFDVVRDVVGPLSYGFSYYKIMPQIARPGADDPARPDQRGRAADGARAAREHPPRRELQRRELLPGRQGERRPRRSRRPSTTSARDAIVHAIKDRLGGAGRRRRAGGRGVRRRRQRPHRPGGRARQLHGLHHDQQRRARDRDRLPGQGRHDGHQRPR